MHNRERLSSEQLNQMKREILHDFNPVISDKEELIAFWESLSICEKDSILMVYDLAVIDDLAEILAMLPELTHSSQSQYPSSHRSSSNRSQQKNKGSNVSHCEQIIKMPEKQILLEFLYLDRLETLLSNSTNTPTTMSSSYFNQMCLIVNRISNESQFQSLLNMHTVKDCSDWGLVSGKKKVLKFKSSALFSIFDALDDTVDSFCLGEKVLLRKRHYAVLYSQLVRKHSPPQSDINDTISSILQFLGIVFENNLIKAYLKSNRFSSTKNPIRDLPTTLAAVAVAAGVASTSTITTTATAETTTAMSTPSTTATPNTTQSPDEKQSINSHSDLTPTEVSLLEEINLNIRQSQDQDQEAQPLEQAPLSVVSVSAPVFEHRESGFEPICKFKEESSSQAQRKSKKLTYCESEVEYMFSYYYCLVNTSSLLIKVHMEEENEKVDSDEDYYTQDEKENFHFNQDLLDYDIADVLGDSFKFEPSLCLSKDSIRILKDQMQQQHQQYSQSILQLGLPSSSAASSTSQQPSQSSSSASKQQQYNSTSNNIGGGNQSHGHSSSYQQVGQPGTSGSGSSGNTSKHSRESKQSEHSEQSSQKQQHQRMMTDIFGQAAGMLPDFSNQFNPQNPLYLMFLMNQQMMMNSQSNYPNSSASNNQSRSGGGGNNNHSNGILGNTLHSKYSNNSKNSNHSHKQSGGQRDNGSAGSHSNSNPFLLHPYDGMSNQFQASQNQQQSSSSRNKGGKQAQQQQQQQQMQQPSQQSGQPPSNQISRSKKTGGNPPNQRTKKSSSTMNPEDDSRSNHNSSNNNNNNNNNNNSGSGGNGNSKRAVAAGGGSNQDMYQRSQDQTSAQTESGSAAVVAAAATAANNNNNGSKGKSSQNTNNRSKKSNSNKNYDTNASSSMGQLSFLPQSQVQNSNSFNQLQHHQFSLVPITGNQLRRSKE